MFSAQNTEKAAGLVHLDARWYNPQTTRFVQPDLWNFSSTGLSKEIQHEVMQFAGLDLNQLLKDPGQQMRFGYVSHNPLSWIDPFGLAELVFVYDASEDDLSDLSKDVLSDAADSAGIDKIFITSTQRSAEDQAKIMYDYAKDRGTEEAYNLYKDAGDKVIDTYVEQTKSDAPSETVINQMASKIEEVGPSNVSSHISNGSKLQVVDVANNLIPEDKRDDFATAIQEDERVSKYLGPNTVPVDRAHHIEIPQNTECP